MSMLRKLNALDLEENYYRILRASIIGSIVCKLVLMGLFSSDYQDLMFIPFVRCFLEGENPYQYYYEHELLPSFPYPPIMLIIESIGGALAAFCGTLPVFMQNLLFKMPLLFMDLLGLYYLMRISESKRKYILALYFLSPILLYATYMHGQLDIIPTVFLVGAIYYLTQIGVSRRGTAHNEWKFVFFLTLSLASKLHIAVVLPLFFLYIYKKKGHKKAVVMTGLPVLFTALITAPFWGSGFVNMVPDGKTIMLIPFLAAMAPSASSITQMAQVYHKDAQYASAINVVSTVLCVVTMPLMVTLYQMVV